MPLDYREYPPPPTLAPYVHRVWQLAGMGETEVDAALPDGRPELVLNSGDPFLHYGALGARHQPRILLAGQMTEPFRLGPGPIVDVIGYRFHPGGLHALLGVPMEELTDRDAAVEDLAPRLARWLSPLLGIVDPAKRMAAASAALVRTTTGAGNGPIARAALAIARANGRVRIDAVAVSLGISPRHAARRFAREIGLGPKLLGRICRFQWFLREAPRRPPGSLARLAHDAGYCDQSHVIRDFREFAASTPAGYFGEAHPIGKALAGL